MKFGTQRFTQFLFFFILLSSHFAGAAMRIVTRSDYGQKGLAPITDRMNGLTDMMTGQPLGGGYDLVFQENIESHFTEIYQCPTANKCQGNSSCMMNPKFWNCQTLYKAEHQEFCRYYKTGTRALTVASWASGEILGGIIINQIAFLKHGIGLLAVDLSEVVDDYHLVKDLIAASCGSEGLDVALQNVNSNGLLFAQERKKEQVNTALTVFKASNTLSEDGPFPLSSQQAGRLSPLRGVFINPTIINKGLLKVVDQP